MFRMLRLLSASSRKSDFESSPELTAHLKTHLPLSPNVLLRERGPSDYNQLDASTNAPRARRVA